MNIRLYKLTLLRLTLPEMTVSLDTPNKKGVLSGKIHYDQKY